jgi:hypothetical protein
MDESWQRLVIDIETADRRSVIILKHGEGSPLVDHERIAFAGQAVRTAKCENRRQAHVKDSEDGLTVHGYSPLRKEEDDASGLLGTCSCHIGRF